MSYPLTGLDLFSSILGWGVFAFWRSVGRSPSLPEALGSEFLWLFPCQTDGRLMHRFDTPFDDQVLLVGEHELLLTSPSLARATSSLGQYFKLEFGFDEPFGSQAFPDRERYLLFCRLMCFFDFFAACVDDQESFKPDARSIFRFASKFQLRLTPERVLETLAAMGGSIKFSCDGTLLCISSEHENPAMEMKSWRRIGVADQVYPLVTCIESPDQSEPDWSNPGQIISYTITHANFLA